MKKEHPTSRTDPLVPSTLDTRPLPGISESQNFSVSAFPGTALPQLRLFTQPEILKQIGPPRLLKLFALFQSDLATDNFQLPSPESENGSYFNSLAKALTNTLPSRLQGTLHALETLAAPDSEERLDSAIQRRIPNVSVSQTCALDRALELWFHAPEEFSSFQIPLFPGNTETPTHPSTEAPPSAPLLPDTTEPPIHRSTDPLAPSTLDTRPLPGISESQNFSVSAFLENPSSILDSLVKVLNRFVVLPKYAAETLALWILHTYAFHLRDITTYIGIESPEKRCGKTTLLSVLNELANRALASSNISPPAFFRVIEDLSPTLLIDEVDTFLSNNEQLRGILNAGYNKKTAFVLRAVASPTASGEADTENAAASGAVKRFSCWCPKVLAKIGHFPDTLADRCIIIRMQRKTSKEKCERPSELDSLPLKQQCLRFVADHTAEIGSAKPQMPPELNDRAADIWEPLLVLADLAGGEWPELARKAAVTMSATAQDNNPIGSLLLDILILFTDQKADRMFTHSLIAGLNGFGMRPWREAMKAKEITDLWLAQQLRPYGIKPKTLRIGDKVLKGYLYGDMFDIFQRYIPKSEVKAFLAEHTPEVENAPNPTKDDDGDENQSAAA